MRKTEKTLETQPLSTGALGVVETLPKLSEKDFIFYINSLIRQRDQYPDDSAEHRHNRKLINEMADYAIYRRYTLDKQPLTHKQYVTAK